MQLIKARHQSPAPSPQAFENIRQQLAQIELIKVRNNHNKQVEAERRLGEYLFSLGLFNEACQHLATGQSPLIEQCYVKSGKQRQAVINKHDLRSLLYNLVLAVRQQSDSALQILSELRRYDHQQIQNQKLFTVKELQLVHCVIAIHYNRVDLLPSLSHPLAQSVYGYQLVPSVMTALDCAQDIEAMGWSVNTINTKIVSIVCANQQVLPLEGLDGKGSVVLELLLGSGFLIDQPSGVLVRGRRAGVNSVSIARAFERRVEAGIRGKGRISE